MRGRSEDKRYPVAKRGLRGCKESRQTKTSHDARAQGQALLHVVWTALEEKRRLVREVRRGRVKGRGERER